jgi:chromosome segregation protein
MHLKKIEIQGFKSFPEYTLIEFDKGMTAIVGPNGSGKSNVTDAIRWVLGEQSVRTLRGGKMEDVIFNGTQSRRAMNYAEVSITIDNSDGVLEIDYSEVQVARRLYRSGESEFQINHVNCRLKDVLRLFMDTGLGKDGYSIVGQGRIDEILSSRSEDRRKVIEEASGIVKYKARKEEAERKLLSTEQNLIRISDILSELAEQIEPLEDQAKKAKQYHRLYDEWKELDIGLSLHLIDRNRAFLSVSDQDAASVTEEVRTHEDSIIRLRNQNRELTEKSSQIEDMLEEAREKKSTIADEMHAIMSSVAVLSDRRKQLSARLLNEKDNDVNFQSEIERLDHEFSFQSKKIETLKKQKEKFSGELLSKEKEMSEILSSMDLSQKKKSSLRARMEEMSGELFEYREQSQALSSEFLIMDSRIKNLSEDRITIISEKDTNTAVYEDAQTELQKINKDYAKMSGDLSVVEKKLSDIRQGSVEKIQSLEQKSRELDNVNFRTKTLEELEKSREGYQEPVRRLMSDAAENAEVSSKIVGILGELIRVPKEYETAIEIALGQSMHNIVTNTDKDAEKLIEHLKTNKLGRATFLPINTIRSRELEPSAKKITVGAKGFIGIASDLIRFDESISGIVGNLLGKIAIFDRLDNALKTANISGFSFKMVTLEGDVVNAGGSLSGGSIRRQGTSLLGRARELEELNARSVNLIDEITLLKKNNDDLESEIKNVAREHAALDDKLRNLQLNRVKKESELDKRKTDIERLSHRLVLVEKELEGISAKRLTIQKDRDELLQSVNESESELTRIRSSISENDDMQRSVQEKLDEIRSEIGDLKISVESLEISMQGANEICEMINREKNNHSEGLKKMIAEREQAKVEVEILKSEEESKLIVKQELTGREEHIISTIKNLMLEKEEIEHQLSGFIDKLSSESSRLTQFQNEQTRLEAKRERYTSEIDDLKNRLWEDHEITYDNAQSFRLEIDNVQPIQKKLIDLKNELKEIGPVNMNALEEFERVNERYTFMTAQKNDIELAKVNLQGIIDELVVEMRQQFLTHFEQINENFKVVFSDLFNGGTAEIILEDQDDILGCGIDIRAQPPGKRLQSLSLLSGGERCLTAIAILFAILQLRPSPFCVLDEVEAALDDVNVNRFTDFVRRYTAKSQFILVTHRKGTMEACDRMYGVTMQERGISKILSMRLGDS